MEDLSFDVLVRYLFSGMLGFVTVRYFIETVKGYRDVVDSTGWGFVEGVIVTSVLHKSWGRNGRSLNAEVEYRYMINDKEYLGDTIKPGFEFTWDTAIPGLNSESIKVSNYPLGKKVSVYYDADMPERCCIEHRSMSSMVLMNLFGFSVLLVVLYMFFYNPDSLNYSIGF